MPTCSTVIMTGAALVETDPGAVDVGCPRCSVFAVHVWTLLLLIGC